MITHILFLTMLSGSANAAPAQSGALQTFDTADTASKNQLLNKITTQTLDASTEDIVELIRRGLVDAEAGVRQRALLAVVSRAGGPRFAKSEGVAARWVIERPLIEGLRESVLTALDDPSNKVRLAAVLALGNLDYDATAETSYALRADTLAALLKALMKESDPRIRGEIVKGLALGAEDSADVRRLFVQGLADGYPGVRRFAAVGVARLRPTEALAPLARLLQDLDPSVRIEAAKALGSFDAEAGAYTSALRNALELESNGSVKIELERALARVKSQ